MNPRSLDIEPTSNTEGRFGGYFAPRSALVLLAVAVLALVLLAPALGGPFLWDDELLIRDNPSIQSFEHWREWLRTSLFDGQTPSLVGSVRYWRPFALLSFALDWQLGGNNPAIFHATNLLLYFVLVLLVGWSLRRYTGNAIAAVLATVLYALHPTHVECAAWISGRMDILVSIGILGSSWALGERIRGRRGWLWPEFFLAAVAYLSKETAVLLPVFCFVEVWIAYGKPPLSRSALKRLTFAVAPHLAIASAYIAARWRWFPLGDLTGANQLSLGIHQRLLVFFETLGRACALSFWPFPQSAQHGLVAVGENGSLQFHYAYVAMGLATASVLACLLVALRRRPSPLLALTLIVFCFLPTSNLGSPWLLGCFTFERYLLLPHFGGAWCLALLAAYLIRRAEPRHLPKHIASLFLVTTLIALAFAWRVQQRAADYADADRFWRHELAVNPLSSIAPSHLGALSTDPVTTLSWLQRCHANASSRGQYNDADHCLVAAAEALMNALLDAQVPELGRLEREWKLFLQGAPALGTAPTPVAKGITFAFPRDGTRRERILSSHPGRIQADLAVLYSRLGRHEAATELADASLARCRRCRWTLALASVFAASGQYPRAREILRAEVDGTPELERVRQQISDAESFYSRAQTSAGPQRLHALAQSFLSIGRFGLAFATLNPEETAILDAPEVARDYALIAYRAGHIDTARRALLRIAPPAVVDTIIADWRQEQPRID